MRQLADEHTWTNIDNVRDTTDRIASRSFGHLWFLLKRGFNQDEYPAWLGKIKMEAEQRNEGIEFTEAITVFFNVIHDLPAVAFAKSLNSAIKNKEEDRVLHIIISRQEYDLKDIKLSYSTIYKNQQHLEDHLGIFETETYKSSDVLLRLIREYHQ